MEDVPFEGSVVKVSNKGQVIINRGSAHGVAEGMVMTMESEGELLIDPGTGEVLDEEEGEQIGSLRVARVREKVSYCDVTDGESDPEPGTIVRTE